MKPETRFRTGHVDPFLETLKHAWFTSVQQVTILGTPDKIGLVRGWFVALEIKSTGKVPTTLQAWILDQIHSAGGVALAVRPENWEAVKTFLTGMDDGIFAPQDILNWRSYL